MDLSLFSDENENQVPFKAPIQPIATSTPSKTAPKKTRKANYKCEYCGREYQIGHYYRIHIEKQHGKVTTSDLNVSSAVHINCSDLSFSQLRDDPGSTSKGGFKRPSAPSQVSKKIVSNSKSKKKPSLICTYCLKGYVCSRSFKQHVRAHRIECAAARFPDAAKILENSVQISEKAMLSVATCPSVGDSGARFKHLVGHIALISVGEEWKTFCHNFCMELVDSIRNKKCLLPSSLATSLIDALDNTLSGDKFRYLCDSIKLGDLFESDVISQFLLEFGLNLTVEMLKFICSTFRSNSSERIVTEQRLGDLDKEDRQVVYYIAGSIIRGYLKIARRAGKSKTWASVAAVLKSKVLIDKPTGDVEPDSEWTRNVDRGSLLYISSQCQDFFIKLTKVVYGYEKRDGSIDYECVIKSVCDSQLSVEWGDIIGDSLEENVSLNLMNDVILSFCRTCGRGFAKRRLNFVRKKPVVSMPTRHLVASRKNR